MDIVQFGFSKLAFKPNLMRGKFVPNKACSRTVCSVPSRRFRLLEIIYPFRSWFSWQPADDRRGHKLGYVQTAGTFQMVKMIG